MIERFEFQMKRSSLSERSVAFSNGGPREMYYKSLSDSLTDALFTNGPLMMLGD